MNFLQGIKSKNFFFFFFFWGGGGLVVEGRGLE